MKIWTKNPSAFRRRDWVDIPVPLKPPDQRRFRLEGRNWPIFRGVDIGKHTTLLHMYGEWGPHQAINGEANLLTEFSDIQFSPSPWVGDNPLDLFTHPVIKYPGRPGRVAEREFETLTEVESPSQNSNVRQVMHLKARLKDTMFVMDIYAYIYTFSDAVRIEGTFTNSDPRSPLIDEEIEQLGLLVGEFFSMTNRDHFQTLWPYRTGAPGFGWIQLTEFGQRVVADGQQIRFSGNLLCLPTEQKMQGHLNLFDERTRERMNSLYAYMTVQGENMYGGRIVGMGDFASDNRWLAFSNAPEFPLTEGSPLQGFENLIRSKSDIYAARQKNLAKSAGQTGSQEDFGASKGGSCVRGAEPMLIRELEYMVNAEMRPFHNRQIDGSPITKESNPRLWTWSQLPIGTTEPGPADDLGKGFDPSGIWPPWRTGTGYSGIDDQHRSQNTFNAAYALTGSYLLRSILFDFYEIDRTQVPNRIGAPRAVGRLFQSWANMLLLLPAEKATVLADHMKTRMDVVLHDWFGKNVPVEKPIRVIGTARSHATLTDSEGNPVEAWVVWEHAIAVMGFYAAMLNTRGPQSDIYKWAATHFSKLVALFGCFFDGVSWRCCTAVRYRRGTTEGDPVDYSVDSQDIKIGDGFWKWTLPAIKICERLTTDSNLRDRCEAIIQQVEGIGPNTWSESEWWAV